MKTTWKELIKSTKKFKGNKFKIQVTAKHYLIEAYDKKTVYTIKNKWRAMINMKLYAILYDFVMSDDYGIYYNMEEIEE